MWIKLPDEDFNLNAQWREKWLNAIVPNKQFVSDPTIPLPGFNLPRRKWSMLNRYRSGHGIAYVLRLSTSGACVIARTVNDVMSNRLHIVEQCPLTKLNGGLKSLNTACTEAIALIG